MSGPSNKARTDASGVVHLDERQLLPRHHRGDANAFEELMASYRAPVFGYLVRCGVEPALRDDLFQEIFLSIHRAAESYQPTRPLKPWLFTIVANTVRSHYRRRRVQELVFPDGSLEQSPADAADGEELAAARETASWFDRAITRLPFQQREVVLLCCVEQLEQKEVATTLELPLNTVKTLLRRARLALARDLSRRKAQQQREVSP